MKVVAVVVSYCLQPTVLRALVEALLPQVASVVVLNEAKAPGLCRLEAFL